MLDEVARYLRVAKGAVGKTSLAEQTVAFLMSLLKFASEKERVVVVLTLAESSDAFGTESDDVRQQLAEAKSLSSRVEHIITPTAETELSAIVTHRLFKKVDSRGAKASAKAYAKYYQQQQEREVDLPSRATRSEYTAEIETDYPFHPELLTTLNRKTSTIPNFQKTRGALRLLAMTVRQLWKEKPGDAFLIHPYHLDLAVEDIANDLTSRLERQSFKQVVEADIVTPRAGTRAHAQEIDAEWVEAGKPAYAERVATAVFLHSLTQTGQSGVTPEDLRLAVLQPGDDPALVDKAIERLYETGWYFDYDGHHYRFRPEPSLNKLVSDEMGMVGRVKAKEELDGRIRKVWKKGVLHPAWFPTEAGEVDDDAKAPKLVVVHYDAATCEPGDRQPPELVVKLFEHSGTLEGYRTYKNNVLFLAADQSQTERMIENVQRYLAIQRIVGDAGRMKDFTPEQQKKLKGMRESAELDVRVAITRAYRFLFYPSADAPKKAGNLACEQLPAQDQGEIEKDQTAVVLRVLKTLEKVLTADDKPLAAAYVKAKAWPQNADSVTTEELRKEFCKRLGLKILLDVNHLKTTIKDGVKRKVWVYYSPEEGLGYGTYSPAPLVSISDDDVLYTPEEAARVKLKMKGEEETPEVCPLCHKHPCVCGEEIEEEKKAKAIKAEGAPAQAFQQVVDQCRDQSTEKLKTLCIHIEGHGKEGAKDAASLGLAIPQMGKGEYRVEQSMQAEFGKGETFNVSFTGPWDRYKRVKGLTDAFGREASDVRVNMTVRADFPDGLDVTGPQFQTIRDVLASLNMGRLYVDAEPLVEYEQGEE